MIHFELSQFNGWLYYYSWITKQIHRAAYAIGRRRAWGWAVKAVLCMHSSRCIYRAVAYGTKRLCVQSHSWFVMSNGDDDDAVDKVVFLDLGWVSTGWQVFLGLGNPWISHNILSFLKIKLPDFSIFSEIIQFPRSLSLKTMEARGKILFLQLLSFYLRIRNIIVKGNFCPRSFDFWVFWNSQGLTLKRVCVKQISRYMRNHAEK